MKQLRGEYLNNRNAYIVSGEPMIFHCHHYNCFLQASIEEAKSMIDVYPILIHSAEEVVYAQLSSHFTENPSMSIDDRKAATIDFYKFMGFGLLDLSSANESGGTINVSNEHYSTGWMHKYGARKDEELPVSFFSLGLTIGALEAIYNLELGTLNGEQSKCLTKGDDICEFIIKTQSSSSYNYVGSPREGEYVKSEMIQPSETDVNYGAIREALSGMPIEGGEKGSIEVFGVLLTRHYANYYCLISYQFFQEMEKKHGEMGVTLATELLTEAGHVCAFNTFGGIMESAEWYGLIMPMIKTREDWIHGILACVNSLGWGNYAVEELVPGEKFVLSIKGGYESNAYLKRWKTSEHPMSYLAKGGAAGIMNLLYNADIIEKPTLDEAYYRKTFCSNENFSSVQTKCRAMGDSYDQFTVQK